MRLTCLFCRESFYCRPSKPRKYCKHKCYTDHTGEQAAEMASRGVKNCPKCATVKSLEMFSPCFRGTGGKAGWCKSCKAESERVRRLRPGPVARHKASYEHDMAYRAVSVLRAIGKRCKRNGWPFDLDHEWLVTRLHNGHCELTGLPFNMAVSNRRPGPHTPSVDRRCPPLGYTKSNCRLILHALNIAMLDYGYDAFLPIAEALVARHRVRATA